MPPKRGRKSLSKPEVPIKEVAKPAPTAQASPGKTVTVENADVEMSLPKVDGPPLSKEAKLLSESFKNILVKTGQLLRLGREAQKRHNGVHLPRASGTLHAALAQDVERYDQLCDIIESQLKHAVAILSYEIEQERERQGREAELANPTSTIAESADVMRPPSILVDGLENEGQTQDEGQMSAGGASRRPSSITLSNLQSGSSRPGAGSNRPPLLKLDLSSATLRAVPNELFPSPVTLGPRSSVSQFPPLTGIDGSHMSPTNHDPSNLLPGILSALVEQQNASNQGFSRRGAANNPIEVDLSAEDPMGKDGVLHMGLFGSPTEVTQSSMDGTSGVQSLFTSTSQPPPSALVSGSSTDTLSLLSAFASLDPAISSSQSQPPTLVSDFGSSANADNFLAGLAGGDPSSQTTTADEATLTSALQSSAMIGATKASNSSITSMSDMDMLSSMGDLPDLNESQSILGDIDMSNIDLSSLSPTFFNNYSSQSLDGGLEELSAGMTMDLANLFPSLDENGGK